MVSRATKHALEGWSDCSRLELKQFGINVVIIEPGAIKTEFDEVMDQQFIKDNSSPYKKMKHNVAKVMKNVYKPVNYSEPMVISDMISKAINSKSPKIRYAAGKMARQTLIARR